MSYTAKRQLNIDNDNDYDVETEATLADIRAQLDHNCESALAEFDRICSSLRKTQRQLTKFSQEVNSIRHKTTNNLPISELFRQFEDIQNSVFQDKQSLTIH